MKWIKKLWQYYELIFFTFLPREIMSRIFELVPGLEAQISHTLCKEDLVPGEGVIYKDLTFLAHNRVSNLNLDQDGEEQT
jgi:TFIIF-interacting CTD phosphatase-like protein